MNYLRNPHKFKNSCRFFLNSQTKNSRINLCGFIQEKFFKIFGRSPIVTTGVFRISGNIFRGNSRIDVEKRENYWRQQLWSSHGFPGGNFG